MQRGTCPFAQKAENAQAANASAAVIFNEGQPGRQETLAGTLGEDTTATIPVIGTSFVVGEELAGMPGAVVHITTSTLITPNTSSNLIADLAPRRERTGAKVVLDGAHLDSVPEGPGINDNGSGTATILEIAEEMAEARRAPENRVRFAFWGAEEAGLVGSTRYVAALTEAEAAKIGLNLNFDMLGSPNFVRFVYDGDGSTFGTAGPPGSDDIERTFRSYFTSQGLVTDPTAFDGRSDYKPFIDVGIPAGGLFSGAEGEKTVAQQARYGGTAGAPYDPCYHDACDTFANNNNTVLGQFAKGAAHATAIYATRERQLPAVQTQVGARSSRSFDDGPRSQRRSALADRTTAARRNTGGGPLGPPPARCACPSAGQPAMRESTLRASSSVRASSKSPRTWLDMTHPTTDPRRQR